MWTILRVTLSLPARMFDAYWWPKLRRNPLYSDRLYPALKTPSGTPRSAGIYNFYLVSIAAFGLITWLGWLNLIFFLVLAASTLLAMWLDRMPWREKVSWRDMPNQLFRYGRILFYVLRTEILILIVATGLVYGLIKPFTRNLDAFSGYTFVVLYGIYLVIRIAVYARYMLIVAFWWDTYVAPPFSIRKANFRDRKTTARHLTWSFLLGNVGLVVRCGYYDLAVRMFDSFYDVVGYPSLSGAWGIALAAVVVVFWFLLADYRLGHPYYKAHRALHEDQALYASIHRVHHYAVYPTVLDSGTINPAEFLLTESGMIWLAPLPDWFFVVFQIGMLVGHFEGHHTLDGKHAEAPHYQFHVLHHRLYHCNYGTPMIDEKFDTLVAWSEKEGFQPSAMDRDQMVAQS